ncbi:hypothetical protein GCM10011325_35270 [Dyadobacter sediminis]|nr:hypothetical protein GCM10011325_35270 [Dyadobacter sediminis]
MVTTLRDKPCVNGSADNARQSDHQFIDGIQVNGENANKNADERWVVEMIPIWKYSVRKIVNFIIAKIDQVSNKATNNCSRQN